MKGQEENQKVKYRGKSALSRIWEKPAGKIAIITETSLIAIVGIGSCFKLFAFDINGYKDLRDFN